MRQVPTLQQDLMAKHYEGKNDEGKNEERKNEEGIPLHLDLLDEVKATVEQRMVRYQDLMAKHYNANVKP